MQKIKSLKIKKCNSSSETTCILLFICTYNNINYFLLQFNVVFIKISDASKTIKASTYITIMETSMHVHIKLTTY